VEEMEQHITDLEGIIERDELGNEQPTHITVCLVMNYNSSSGLTFFSNFRGV